MKDLLVIIVTYNALQWADRCFTSLYASTIVPDVFVIDNGSTDGTQRFIRENYPEVLLEESRINLGFGKANNIGLKYALTKNYKYVYLLNQDAWVLPDTFERLINISRGHTEFGVLSPIQIMADMEHIDDNFVTNVLYNNQRVRPFWIEDMFFNRKEDIYDVSFVMAAHWLITRECLETVGGFNPSFPHYGEDDNYLHRVFYCKYSVGIVPTAVGVHDRLNPKWEKKKLDYILQYIKPIVLVSNPIDKKNLLWFIIIKAGKGLIKGDKNLLRYAFRLFKERRIIESNYKASFSPKAFLV